LEDNVKVGLRLEHGAVTEVSGKKEISFKGKIVLSEVVGSDTIVHVDANLGELIRVAVPAIYRKMIGEEIEVSFNLRDIYVFSPKDGRLLARGGDLFG